MRLDKYLHDTLDISRSEAKNLISKKRVKINDEIITDSGINVLDADIVKVDDEIITYQKYIYLMLNKPMGYVTSCKDKDPIVLDLIEGYKNKIFPVGRLDKNTEGLLILTNDGMFNHFLTDPKKRIPKTYFVKSDYKLTDEEMKTIEEGIHSDTLDTLPAIIKEHSDGYFLTIYEGQYHEIKRIFGHFHKGVTYLKRVSIGGLSLGDLEIGKYRILSEEEINRLKES